LKFLSRTQIKSHYAIQIQVKQENLLLYVLTYVCYIFLDF
jgi:hypothetical protein